MGGGIIVKDACQSVQGGGPGGGGGGAYIDHHGQ